MPRKNRSSLHIKREIDMTPLIDLTFLLLIVFMITMPLLECSTDVSPPEMTSDPIPDENNLMVNLDKNGQIVFDGRVMQTETLTQMLSGMVASGRKMNISLRADGGRSYNEVMNVMKAIKKAGVKEIGLVTLAEERR